MKIYIKSTVSDTKQRGVLEEYLRKYCPEYLKSKNKHLKERYFEVHFC